MRGIDLCEGLYKLCLLGSNYPPSVISGLLFKHPASLALLHHDYTYASLAVFRFLCYG